MSDPGQPPRVTGLPARFAVRLPITVGQFLKLAGLAATGGEAKQLIAARMVLVNGLVEDRRGRKLQEGDIVAIQGAAGGAEVTSVSSRG